MNDLIIRFATKQDAGLIADLSRQTFYDTFADRNTKENMDKFMSEQFKRENLMEEVAAAGNFFIIAEANNETIGYARMRENKNPDGLGDVAAIEIARIYSIQRAIGKGVGSALMKRCIEIAKDYDRRVIWLGVWEKNFKAINFYERWGFKKFAEHDFILGNDVQTDWLMKKNLY